MPLTQSEQYDIDSLRQQQWDNFYWWIHAIWTTWSLLMVALVIAALIRMCWPP